MSGGSFLKGNFQEIVDPRERREIVFLGADRQRCRPDAGRKAPGARTGGQQGKMAEAPAAPLKSLRPRHSPDDHAANRVTADASRSHAPPGAGLRQCRCRRANDSSKVTGDCGPKAWPTEIRGDGARRPGHRRPPASGAGRSEDGRPCVRRDLNILRGAASRDPARPAPCGPGRNGESSAASHAAPRFERRARRRVALYIVTDAPIGFSKEPAAWAR